MRRLGQGILALCLVGTLGHAAMAADAKALFEKKCKVCHSIAGDGGAKKEVGGPLDGVGKKRDEAWLRAYFADPKSKIETSKMPKMKLEDDEWDALVAYMLSLK